MHMMILLLKLYDVGPILETQYYFIYMKKKYYFK